MPRSVPILSAKDFCKKDNQQKGQNCLLGWFNKTFCMDDEAYLVAEKENPVNKDIKPIIMSWIPVKHKGISTKRKYKNWKTKALQALIKECKKVDKHSRYKSFSNSEYHISREINSFNDHDLRSHDTLARVWNRTMARLGYTENNPEA